MDIIYKINKYTDKLKDLYIRKNYNIDTYNNYATKLNYYYSIFGGGKTTGETITNKKKFVEGASLLEATTDEVEDNGNGNKKKKKGKGKGKGKEEEGNPKEPTQGSTESGSKKAGEAKAGEAKAGEAKPAKPKLTEQEIQANIAASRARKEERNAQQKAEGKAIAKEQKEKLNAITPKATEKGEDANESEMRLDNLDLETDKICPEFRDYSYQKLKKNCVVFDFNAGIEGLETIDKLEKIKFDCKKAINKENCEKCKVTKEAKISFCRKIRKGDNKGRNKESTKNFEEEVEKDPSVLSEMSEECQFMEFVKDKNINVEQINKNCTYKNYKNIIKDYFDNDRNRNCILRGNEEQILKPESKASQAKIMIAQERQRLYKLLKEGKDLCEKKAKETKPEGEKNKRERKEETKEKAKASGCPITYKYEDKGDAKLKRDCETKSAEVYSKLEEEEKIEPCKEKITALKARCETIKAEAIQRKNDPNTRLCKHTLVKEKDEELRQICRNNELKYDEYKKYLSVENNKDCDDKGKIEAERKRKLCVSQHGKSIKNEKKRDKIKEKEKASGKNKRSSSTDGVTYTQISSLPDSSSRKSKDTGFSDNNAKVNSDLVNQLKNKVCSTSADNILPNATDITRNLIRKLHGEICE